VLTDIAARGRSLGVHLILCTQRPAGAMRDALLANCGLRLSLRVNNRADSQAVVGTDAAASLAQSMPGRCIVGVDGRTTTIQVATTSADDIARVLRLGEFTGEGSSAPQPWLDPLPDMIPLAGLAPVDARDFVLGVEDVPEEQRQNVVSYRPERDGSLLVLGAHASGATTLLACLAAQPGWPGVVVSVGPGVEAAWDTLCGAAGRCAARHDVGPHLLLLADDIDSLHARLSPDHQQRFAEMLATVLRDGPAAGVWLVATAQRLHGQLAHLATLVGEQLLMRLPNRQEHVLAGADPRLFDERMPAGGAVWRGHRVQLAWPSAGAPPAGQEADCAPILEFRPGIRYLLVSRSPRLRADQLRALGDRVVVTELDDAGANGAALTVNGGGVASVTIGDPDGWQAQWALLAATRHDATMIFDGCSLADVRVLARTHTLPPPLGPGPDRVWLCDGEGGLSRARLAGGPASPPMISAA
jgi:S-DNA-T family DNA segregation ATPase FtsK/SpoIIIE